MNLFESPGFLINRLAHLMANELDARLKKHGVTISQWAVLSLLNEREGVPQVEIQQKLGIEGATVTGLLQRMEKSGFIRRDADLQDRRVQRVFMTDLSRSLTDLLTAEAEAVNEKTLQGFTSDEKAFFLRMVVRAMQNY
ncbi:MarR family transcriptional regulator [Paenibacillus sp. P25]|nr:MarR family transcriptional regulator [Paenibacillus sp. P25]